MPANESVDNNRPLSLFLFKVDFGEEAIAFQEVSGLTQEAHIIEYRKGESASIPHKKFREGNKLNNVTLKKGVMASDSKFWEWFRNEHLTAVERKPVTITLMDESGNAIMHWKLKNAWPTKVTGTDLKASGNEVAIESIELAHEGLEIKKM